MAEVRQTAAARLPKFYYTTRTPKRHPSPFPPFPPSPPSPLPITQLHIHIHIHNVWTLHR